MKAQSLVARASSDNNQNQAVIHIWKHDYNARKEHTNKSQWKLLSILCMLISFVTWVAIMVADIHAVQEPGKGLLERNQADSHLRNDNKMGSIHTTIMVLRVYHMCRICG